MHRCLLLLQGKLIGGIIGPIQPFVAGLFFGPMGVGTYDTLVRLARVSKVLVGLLTSALLPVASRLDERGSSTTFQRLGELGLIMLPMFTLPPLAAAAILSPEILQMWIGPLLAPYALWMGLSFVIPICAQYLAIGNVIFLTRPGVQARLNWLLEPAIADLGRGRRRDAGFFAERSLILGQAVGSLVGAALANRHTAPRPESRARKLPESSRNSGHHPDNRKHSAVVPCRLHSG